MITIGRLGNHVDGFQGREGFDFSMVGVDKVNGASKSRGEDICDDLPPNRGCVWSCGHDGE